MADPLGRAVAGTPMRGLSASAWNRMLDASRAFDTGAGNPSGVDVPHCLVRVRNDTGGDLAAFSVLKLGASILDITVPLRVAPTPMFVGTTPAATTDAFAVLMEPALDGKLALAAIAGVVPVEVNVTDAGHGYATPTASSAARLTSAASGPARILDRVTGTGNKKAVVSLEGSAATGSVAVPSLWHTSGAGGASGAAYTLITSIDVDPLPAITSDRYLIACNVEANFSAAGQTRLALMYWTRSAGAPATTNGTVANNLRIEATAANVKYWVTVTGVIHVTGTGAQTVGVIRYDATGTAPTTQASQTVAMRVTALPTPP